MNHSQLCNHVIIIFNLHNESIVFMIWYCSGLVLQWFTYHDYMCPPSPCDLCIHHDYSMTSCTTGRGPGAAVRGHPVWRVWHGLHPVRACRRDHAQQVPPGASRRSQVLGKNEQAVHLHKLWNCVVLFFFTPFPILIRPGLSSHTHASNWQLPYLSQM